MKTQKILSVVATALLFSANAAFSQEKVTMTVDANNGKYTISKHIYGHFSEHLGHCIYGGFYVGEDSSIPNIDGVRKDVIEALKAIKIPNLRWPGGCFADEYHWMDGIGPKEKRAKMINTNWGGVVEDNSFGTNEFLNMCEVLECEPYISGNVGSGTVEEMAKWIEYMTFDGESPMANLRKENGREKPWKVKFFGIGNETWGCGGNMTAQYYADVYKRYATYCKNYGDNRLFKIACGPSDGDTEWMEVMMKNVGNQMNGISLHHYTIAKNWQDKGSDIEYSDDEYYKTIGSTYEMESIINNHVNIMDRYDPNKRVALMVDEWGGWYNVRPGTNPGFLFQQNTMRDAIIAGMNLNIFNNHCDRVKMANVAQIINVLQSLILTDGDKMVLTPTYHVFDMYKVHQEATLLPINIEAKNMTDSQNRAFPQVNASASIDNDGKIHISLVNVDLNENAEVKCKIYSDKKLAKSEGKIIMAKNVRDYNDFDNKNNVVMYDFSDFNIKDGVVTVNLPARSVVTVELK